MTTREMILKLDEARTLLLEVAAHFKTGGKPCAACGREVHENHDDHVGKMMIDSLVAKVDVLSGKLATKWQGRSL